MPKAKDLVLLLSPLSYFFCLVYINGKKFTDILYLNLVNNKQVTIKPDNTDNVFIIESP